MQNKYLYFLRHALALTDFLMLNCAFYAAFNLLNYYKVDEGLNNWKYILFMINLTWFASVTIFKLYQFGPLNNLKQIFKGTVQSISLQLLIFLLYSGFTDNLQHLPVFLITFTVLTLLLLLVNRLILIKTEPVIKKILGLKKSIALLDIDPFNRLLAPYMTNNAMHYNFETFAPAKQGNLLADKSILNSSCCHLFKDAADKGLTDVYISVPPTHMQATADLQREADRYGIRLKLIYDFSQYVRTPAIMNYIGNFPVLSLRKEPLEDVGNRVTKRIFDIGISLIAIIFVLSWLYPLLALLIICDDKGPVLYKQMRSGRHGRSFVCYKFRSMKVNKNGDSKQASKYDDRKTKIGCILRKTSLDELPQFFNVLFGDMSVIGPRPHMLKHTAEYRILIDKYMVRHSLKPGITGWAQVNGFRGETRTLDLMEKRIEHDIWYIENWSILLDLKIVLLTIAHLFGSEENAY